MKYTIPPENANVVTYGTGFVNLGSPQLAVTVRNLLNEASQGLLLWQVMALGSIGFIFLKYVAKK